MSEHDKFEVYVRLRLRYSVEDLGFVFTTRKAKAFEALRLRFFAAGSAGRIVREGE